MSDMTIAEFAKELSAIDAEIDSIKLDESDVYRDEDGVLWMDGSCDGDARTVDDIERQISHYRAREKEIVSAKLRREYLIKKRKALTQIFDNYFLGPRNKHRWPL